MQENYLISVCGRQKVDGEMGEVEITTMGSYVKKGDSRYIMYKEYGENTAEKPVTSILKVDGESCVTLMRGGSGGTRLILENGKRHLCQYDTGSGHLMIGTFTNSLRADLGDEGGHLEVGYTLDFDSELSSFNEIIINIREADASKPRKTRAKQKGMEKEDV